MYSHIETKVIQRAYKPHKCLCCMKLINKGEPYHLEKGVWDGNFQTLTMHLDCREFFDKWHRASGEEEFSVDELNEAWNEAQEGVTDDPR